MAADFTFSFTTVGIAARIYQIQGAAHVSPLDGQLVSAVPGVVTSVRPNSFTMQDATGDGSTPPPTRSSSSARASARRSTVGQAVTVSGRVTEFRPGGATSANLTTTEITSPTVTPGGPGAAIAQTVVGARRARPADERHRRRRHGRRRDERHLRPGDRRHRLLREPRGDAPPRQRCRGRRPDERLRRALGARRQRRRRRHSHDPRGHRRSARPTSTRSGSSSRTTSSWMRHPTQRRRPLHDGRGRRPRLRLRQLRAPAHERSHARRQGARARGGRAQARRRARDRHVQRRESLTARPAGEVRGARGPDRGQPALARTSSRSRRCRTTTAPTNTAVTDASLTFQQLIAAIQAAGGPAYRFRQIDPVDDQDGGQPGGNIRVGFLFRTDRGARVRRPAGRHLDDRERRHGPQLQDPSFASTRAASIRRTRPGRQAASRSRASSASAARPTS